MEGVDIPQILHRIKTIKDKFHITRVTTGSSVDTTVELPAAADNLDKERTIMKVDSGTKYVIVDGDGAETIDYLGIQQTTITIELQGRGIVVKSNGTSWDVIDVIGAEIESIGGVLEMVYTKFFTGSLAVAATTNIPHGVSFAEILSVVGHGYNDSGTYFAVMEFLLGSSSANEIAVYYNATYIVFSDVAAVYRGNQYNATMKYYI